MPPLAPSAVSTTAVIVWGLVVGPSHISGLTQRPHTPPENGQRMEFLPTQVPLTTLHADSSGSMYTSSTSKMLDAYLDTECLPALMSQQVIMIP